MSESEMLTPRTPTVTSHVELRNIYIDRAKRNNAIRAGGASAPFSASSGTLGAEWGVGVGLHFELLKWLRWLSLLLMLCSIPFLVVVGCSTFTDAIHKYDHDYGVKKYSATKIHSMTFAAIVDDSIDNGTLQYMNTEIGNTWKGPMQKSTFLIWTSLVDAGSMFLYVCGLAALWYHLRRFAKATDKATLEASDYTVLVCGLPHDTDAAQVGEHFSRYGDVMDVVVVTDRLTATLRHCGRAARLQQRRTMVMEASSVRHTDEQLDMARKLEQKLDGIAGDIRELAEREQHVMAAFVTFNTENERRACTSHCPNSWLASLMQPRQERFQQRKAFWVRKASAPEDYKYEHLAVAEWQLMAREVAINLIMLLLVLVCAAAITKLTDISNQESATIKWFSNKLTTDSTTAMLLYGNSTALAGSSAAELVGAAAKDYQAASTLRLQLASFCTADLSGYCMTQIQGAVDDVVRLEYGQGLTWVNATSRLLLERSVREELECSIEVARTSPKCKLQGCLSCMCLGLSTALRGAGGSAGNSSSSSDVEKLCSEYIDQWDVRSWGIRLAISAVVAVLNSAIKWVLHLLVTHGRHWTHTARERSYALQCFVAMLINTVVVLLLTNCDSLGRLARESDRGSWVRFFVRYGSYSDFTAGWYENVGLSIMILMLINIASPLLNLLIDEMWQAGLRFYVLYGMAWPVQADYDVAWSRPRFTLAQRTADLLLNASLALLFGSGMPLLYLVLCAYLLVAELADRWALTRLCCGAARYHDALCKLTMGLLPWLAVSHCAFGLWMHTYFRVVVPEDGGGDDVSALSAAAVRATNARLSSASKNLSELQRSGVWRRITQPNGLALLLLFVLLALWLLIGRHVVWRLLSCLGRTLSRICCTAASRLMRFRLSRDTELEVHAVPYEEALVEQKLHGTPTYRLAHHPHYLQYFAASGLNRAVGVAALVAVAASGGARRHTYTRLKSVRRRGRLPGSSYFFRVLPEPLIDTGSIASSTAAGRDLGARGLGTATVGAAEGKPAPAPGAAQEMASMGAVGHLLPAAPPETRSGSSDVLAKVPPGLLGLACPPPVAGMVRGPDVVELLLREASVCLEIGEEEGHGHVQVQVQGRRQRQSLGSARGDVGDGAAGERLGGGGDGVGNGGCDGRSSRDSAGASDNPDCVAAAVAAAGDVETGGGPPSAAAPETAPAAAATAACVVSIYSRFNSAVLRILVPGREESPDSPSTQDQQAPALPSPPGAGVQPEPGAAAAGAAEVEQGAGTAPVLATSVAVDLAPVDSPVSLRTAEQGEATGGDVEAPIVPGPQCGGGGLDGTTGRW